MEKQAGLLCVREARLLLVSAALGAICLSPVVLALVTVMLTIVTSRVISSAQLCQCVDRGLGTSVGSVRCMGNPKGGTGTVLRSCAWADTSSLRPGEVLMELSSTPGHCVACKELQWLFPTPQDLAPALFQRPAPLELIRRTPTSVTLRCSWQQPAVGELPPERGAPGGCGGAVSSLRDPQGSTGCLGSPVPLRCREQAGPGRAMPSFSRTSRERPDTSELWQSHVVTAQAVGFGNFRVGFGVIAKKIPTH